MLAGEGTANHGTASIIVNNGLKHKISGQQKTLHTLTPFELLKSKLHSHKALVDDKHIQYLRTRETELENRISELVQCINLKQLSNININITKKDIFTKQN